MIYPIMLTSLILSQSLLMFSWKTTTDVFLLNIKTLFEEACLSTARNGLAKAQLRQLTLPFFQSLMHHLPVPSPPGHHHPPIMIMALVVSLTSRLWRSASMLLLAMRSQKIGQDWLLRRPKLHATPMKMNGGKW